MDSAPKHPETAKSFTALLAALDITAGRLAKEISTAEETYSQQLINNYVLGKNKPKPAVLAAIQRRYPTISAAWLLTGTGEPFPSGRFGQEAPVIPMHPVAPAPGVSPDVLRELFAQMQQLRDDLKEERIHHKAEIKRARKDCLDAQRNLDEQYQAIIAQLNADIYYYKGQLGLRPLTQEEQEAQQRGQPQQRAGFRPSSVYGDQPEAKVIKMGDYFPAVAAPRLLLRQG